MIYKHFFLFSLPFVELSHAKRRNVIKNSIQSCFGMKSVICLCRYVCAGVLETSRNNDDDERRERRKEAASKTRCQLHLLFHPIAEALK
jgi:hypothetical protein